MTFQTHPPYPAGQCFGPQCKATARDEDKGLIPRFCSDPCRDRFVTEHRVYIDPLSVPVHLHPELRDSVVQLGLEPSGQLIVAAKPKTCEVELTFDTSELNAALARLARAWATSFVPAFQAIAAVVQNAIRAWAPLIEQLHRTTKRTGPPPLPFDGHAYRNRTRRRTRRNR